MIHYPNDGRPLRQIFVDGTLIPQAFYADTDKGIVRAYTVPLTLNEEGDAPVSYEVRGLVTVEYLDEEGTKKDLC